MTTMNENHSEIERENKQIEVPMMEEQRASVMITTDGTLDIHGLPANKTRTGGWRAAPLIFGMELCERMASLGLQRNLVTYFVNEMHISIPRAANMVSNFVGTLYLTPFIGGFLADAYLGRFWTINIFTSIQLMGMILLTLSATLHSLRPPECLENTCPQAHGSQISVLFVGLYLIALGNGGIKPNVSSMGADQFDEGDPDENKHMSSFFNWFYFTISIGSLISITLFVYLQDNVGFGLGFGIPSGLLVGSLVIFILGSRLYRYKPPAGSSLTRIAQVLVSAIRNYNIPHSYNVNELHEDRTSSHKLAHTNQFRFLDKAAIVETSDINKLPEEHPANDGHKKVSNDQINSSVQGGSAFLERKTKKGPWELCTVTQVEEVKMVLRLLPIWASTFFVWTALAQMETFSVSQGSTMRRNLGPHFKFPPASMSVFELVNVLLFLPLYDKYFVPFARKFTRHQQGITSLQRIGVGIVASILSMVCAALIEVHRINIARKYGLEDKPKATVPMSIFWLTPQYFLRGTTEIFTQVGQLEFFYKESPRNMRSFGTALYLSTIAVGHFLSTAIVTAVNNITKSGDKPGWLTNNLNRSKLSNFYWLLAGLSVVNFLFYLVCSRWYKYKVVSEEPLAPEV